LHSENLTRCLLAMFKLFYLAPCYFSIFARGIFENSSHGHTTQWRWTIECELLSLEIRVN